MDALQQAHGLEELECPRLVAKSLRDVPMTDGACYSSILVSRSGWPFPDYLLPLVRRSDELAEAVQRNIQARGNAR